MDEDKSVTLMEGCQKEREQMSSQDKLEGGATPQRNCKP